MTLRKLGVIVCAAGLMVVSAASEDSPPQHQKWMKDLGSQMGALRKGVDVEKNAADMQATMKEVTAWWKDRTSDVAMKSCNDSSQGAAEILKASQSGDKAGMAAGMKLVGAGCKSCHDAHREKVSENVYRIK